MRKLSIIGLGLLATSQLASAADLPSGPPPVAVQVAAPLPYNWTGVYVGLNAGYGRATGDGSLALTGNLIQTLTSSGDSGNLTGGVAGGQAGFNWQYGPLVTGIELDLQWSGQQVTVVSGCGFGCTITEADKIPWFGTARGRLGVAVDRVFVYGTAGVAWTDFSYTATVAGGGLSVNFLTLSDSKIGWTVGGGIEVGLTQAISIKGEYLFISTSGLTGTASFPAILGGGTVTGTVATNDSIFRGGLNYRFTGR